jgi:hypothetical protein
MKKVAGFHSFLFFDFALEFSDRRSGFGINDFQNDADATVGREAICRWGIHLRCAV